VILNVLFDDYRFDWGVVKRELNKATAFYHNYGINLFAIERIREPLIGTNLHFCEPNGSHAYPFQKKALITYSDWMSHPYQRVGLLSHELGHAIFKLPDHYKESSYYEPSINPCIMRDINELTFCSNCMQKIDEQVVSRRNLRTLGLIGLAFLAGSFLIAKK